MNVLQRRRRVAVIGAGVIGASWSALFLAHGLEVTVHDPRPEARDETEGLVERAAPTLRALGLEPRPAGAVLRFEPTAEAAVAAADVVQENGPEKPAFKQALWPRLAAAAPAHALLLSSSSAIPASVQAAGLGAGDAEAAARLLVGHPFNPPHLVPLVEVVPGPATSPDATEEALAFYRALGKTPQVVHREIAGFVANRLQAALFRECVHLVREGVVTIDELDAIVRHSIGLRWAAGGPFESFHLGGGANGLAGFIAHFGAGLEARWRDLGDPRFDAATTALLLEQAAVGFDGLPREQLEARRDARQLAMLAALAKVA
jgi:ketoreductase RED1